MNLDQADGFHAVVLLLFDSVGIIVASVDLFDALEKFFDESFSGMPGDGFSGGGVGKGVSFSGILPLFFIAVADGFNVTFSVKVLKDFFCAWEIGFNSSAKVIGEAPKLWSRICFRSFLIFRAG